MYNERSPSCFRSGEKEDVKRDVRRKAEAMATRSTAMCLFCLSETNLLSCKRHRRVAFDKLGVLLGDTST